MYIFYAWKFLFKVSKFGVAQGWKQCLDLLAFYIILQFCEHIYKKQFWEVHSCWVFGVAQIVFISLILKLQKCNSFYLFVRIFISIESGHISGKKRTNLFKFLCGHGLTHKKIVFNRIQNKLSCFIMQSHLLGEYPITVW